jgi:hypothetical protein
MTFLRVLRVAFRALLVLALAFYVFAFVALNL